MQRPRLPCLLLFSLLLLHRGSSFLKQPKLLDDGEVCIENWRCKSACCRRSPDPKSCEAHCTRRSPEGGKCNTQIYFGMYSECPCGSNLTCIFPKNQKTFKVIPGNCQKYKTRMPTKKMIF